MNENLHLCKNFRNFVPLQPSATLADKKKQQYDYTSTISACFLLGIAML